MAQVTEEPLKLEQKTSLVQQISQLNEKDQDVILTILSKLVRAFKGQDITPDNVITKLIDVKNILERSNFPSLQEINFQVYCRLVAHYFPDICESFLTWADFRAQALKSYKGFSSLQYVEMVKAQATGQQITPQTSISLGSQYGQPQKKSRLGFLRRNRQETET